MKRIIAVLLFSLVWSAYQSGSAPEATVDVMTFNIRYNNPSDAEHAWPRRKERVARIMGDADLIGVQEALKGQIVDLEVLLPEYAWFGVGRDDGVSAGEFAPIFYRRDGYELLDSGSFWLSEEPDTPGSKGWDAAITRLVTWGYMRRAASEDAFWFFNTHFDHRGKQARAESARLVMARLDSLAGSSVAFVTGDFNAPPTTEAYSIMTSGRLLDARMHASTPPLGPEGTFSGFQAGGGLLQRRIDYIFVDRAISVWSYVAVDSLRDGSYPSDHRPVLVRIELPE